LIEYGTQLLQTQKNHLGRISLLEEEVNMLKRRCQSAIDEREQITAEATRLQDDVSRRDHEIQRLRIQLLDHQTMLESYRNALKEVCTAMAIFTYTKRALLSHRAACGAIA
jgi:chromosome segregation ATPase